MTAPNKAAVAESNADFLARVKAFNATLRPNADIDRLIALAEERVMIEEHRLDVLPLAVAWQVGTNNDEKVRPVFDHNISTAIRSVVEKIGEGNG